MLRNKKIDYLSVVNALKESENNDFIIRPLYALENVTVKQRSLYDSLCDHVYGYVNGCIDHHYKKLTKRLETADAVSAVFYIKQYMFSLKSVFFVGTQRLLDEKTKKELNASVKKALEDRFDELEKYLGKPNNVDACYVLKECRKILGGQLH